MEWRKWLPDRKAYTGLLVGSILAVMVGAVLLVISYVVIDAIFTTGVSLSVANSALNASMYGNMTNITSALNILGIALIVVGISGIIYMLVSLGGAKITR